MVILDVFENAASVKVVAADWVDLAAAALAQEPRSYLYFGFTTVINLYDRVDVVAKWNQAEIRPDAYFCGGAPVANGFPMNIVPEEFRFRASRYFLYDPRQADRIPLISVT